MLSKTIRFCFARTQANFSKFSKTIIPDYFKTEPIIEGQYQVTPTLSVPQNIKRPDYVDNPNPIFGIYHGNPVVHNQDIIRRLKIAGNLAARTLAHLASHVKEGITTDELDKICHKFIIDNNAYPTALGFMHFPKSVCTSVNEVVCHGIPNTRPLKNGDYINLDVTLYIEGVHGDNSLMVPVGDVHPEIMKLIQTTQKALYESIKVCKPGTPFRKIGEVCESIAHENGFSVCELFTGHGVGELLHMAPAVFHEKKTRSENPYVMQPGMVFTIEPIFTMRRGRYQMWSDQMTVVSPYNPSAQWEHTILITEQGHEVITLRDGEKIE
ncbi:methionine aminopeptidase (macronuclear) [Tetrahymena thermophila SB210]|uniref:Methionine aminopeptidase n=1 Tax=Tetrahymena thermophila (strain SB210) TaxID=312017 RepID=I7M699_TETTS|nr:methionine aminopeptidase [Tetrahymena thermophila SB210]EAR84818.1 methionine aminopeptidase [Tetrahymena thermophila SB210]|eukprot:XP_001032481.1 methionine aminopeptidase [Tetrahymena thermophila SB210]